MPNSAPSLYDALSHPPVREAGNAVDLTIYREPGKPRYGRFPYKAPWQGLVEVGGRNSGETDWTDEFEIAYTQIGDAGPLCVFLHGVPCNRAQWEPVQRHIARFCETISIDMLGMGESSQPRMYGYKEKGEHNDCWHWQNDVDYLEKLMQALYPGRKFFLIADDWGSGIASHYAAQHNDRLLGLIHFDAIAFDGYPVNEIQAIGRGALIPNTPEGDAKFAEIFADFDQKLVQILKSMVYFPGVYNQYKMRPLTFPYVDVDYERNRAGDGVTEVAKSRTMHLCFHNIRVLAERSAILSPALLLPYHPQKNPNGCPYEKITVPSLIAWGQYDTMMPAAQTQRFAYALGTDDVQVHYIPSAGHFPHTDQPDYTADTIINFIRRVAGRSALADVNLGNEGIWKGDERELIADLRAIYQIAAESQL